MVIVTKCPQDIMPLDFRLVQKNLDLMKFQKLYFSRYTYGGLLPVFPDDEPYQASLGDFTKNDTVLLLTGIANPRGFVRHFKNYPFKMKVCHFLIIIISQEMILKVYGRSLTPFLVNVK